MGLRKLVSKKVGGILNDITGVSDTAQQSYANNVALWNMQNQYNTPAAQISRMHEAGIDVNPMTYAVGSGNMSTTASSISTPSYSSAGNPISSLVSLITGLEQAKAIEASTKATEANTESTELDNVAKRRRNKVIKDTGIDPKDGGPIGWVASGASAIKDVYGKIEKFTFDVLESIFGSKGGYDPMK